MTKLEKAKQIIKENLNSARHGIFNTRNTVGDCMTNIYNKDGLMIDICFCWEYFEVFGLTREEFAELEEYYEAIRYMEEED